MHQIIVPMLGLLILAGASGADPQEHPTYDAKRRRDPFTPLVREGRLVGASSADASAAVIVSSSTLVLAGILWDPAGRSVALVNETEVKVGDLIGEYRVIEIRPDAVVLDRDGKQHVLHMTYEGSSKGHSQPETSAATGGEGP